MALGPVKPRGRQLVDDLFSAEPAKPRGRELVDDLFGTASDDKSNFDLSGFGNSSKTAADTFATSLRRADTPAGRQEGARREQVEQAQAKPIEADSEVGRMGEAFWRRVRGLGAGGGRLALTALNEVGIDPNGQAAQWLRGKTESAEQYSNRPIEGEQTWDDLKENPSIGRLARFVLEQGASSAADMGLLATGAGLAPYIGLQAGSTAQQRAQNNLQPDADAADVFAALPAAVGSAALERLGVVGIFGPAAKSVAGRIAQTFGAGALAKSVAGRTLLAGATEAITEAAQSPIEYAGSNLGTEAGFDPREALDQAVAGAVAGGFMGAGLHGVHETPGAIKRRMRGQPVAPGVIETAETTAPAVTEADAASPLPTDLIAEGRRVAAASTATTSANTILSENGAPEVGTKVTVTVGGKPRTGTIRDAFVDSTDAELGAQAGLNIELDGGGTMREFFADLKDAGATIAAAPTADEESRAVADMLAGGLDPAATLDAIAETGETPAPEPAPVAALPAARSRASGAVDIAAYMGKARQAESGGNDGAANTRSSASGRYQFTDSTFARYYEKVYGGPVPAGAKNNPEVQDRLMRAMTEENAAGLRRAGIAVDETALYSAHHFGLGGAISMSRNPTAAVDAAVVKANPQFAGMTNAQALQWVGRHIGGQKDAPASDAVSQPAPIEEVDRARMLDEALTTEQVAVPEAQRQESTPAAPVDPVPTSTAVITETPSGKGIALANANDAEIAAIAEAVPKARSTPNKDGALVFAAKWRPEIEATLAKVSSNGLEIPNANLSEARRNEDAGVPSVARDQGSMPVPERQILPEVRGGGNNDQSVVGERLPSFLGGDRPTAIADALGRSDRRDEGLRARERPLGNGGRAGEQQAESERVSDVSRQDADLIPMGKEDRSVSADVGATQERGNAGVENPVAETASDRERGRGAQPEGQVSGSQPIGAGVGRDLRLGSGDVAQPTEARLADEGSLGSAGSSQARVTIRDTLSGGMSVAEAAVVAQRRAAQGDPIATGNTRLPEGYTFAKDSGGALFLQGPDRQMVGTGPLASPGLTGVKLKNAIDKGVSMAEMRVARATSNATTSEPATPAARPTDRSVAIIMDPAAGTTRIVPAGNQNVAPTTEAAPPAPTMRRPVDKKNQNPFVRAGEKLRFTQTVGYAGGNPEHVYTVSTPGKRSAFVTNDTTGGSTSLNNYEIEAGLKSGAIVRVDSPAAEPAIARSPKRYEYDETRTGAERAVNRATVDKRNGQMSKTEMLEVLGNIVETGDVAPAYVKVMLDRDDDVNEGEVRAVVARAPKDASEETAADRRQQRATARAAAAEARAPATSYGASNKLVSTDRAAVLREKLRAKMNQINSGIDPEVLALGAELAVFHIEAGARKFADFSSRMVAEIGESVRPFLRSFYESARYYPGMDAIARDMSTAAQIEEEGSGDQGAVRDRDAGPSTADVQPATEDRGAGRAPAGEVDRGGADVQGSERGGSDASERADAGRRPAEGDRGTGPVDADRVPARAADAGRGRRDGARDAAAERVIGENWRIEPGSLDETRGAAQKARDNVRAIEIVRELDASGAPATREQQAALAKYVGWGGLKNAFSDTGAGYSKGFEKIGPRVRELLSDEEFNTARQSVQYAHYTSEQIIRPMWDAVKAMGFTGGKVFEPGMGTGNFLGMMPAEIAARSQYQGVEFDGITARIAQLLYPQSGIRQADFTQGVLPRDTYDLVIGNPPFSQTVIRSDPNYGNLGFVLHDFFFAKSLDAVRPGGLLMFVTSAGTMNKVGDKARAWMAERADLVGAVRLPGGAFRENAGTDVTTDIIVLKKREAGAAPGPRTWVGTTDMTLPSRSGGTAETAVNSYFAENPDQVLGEQGLFDTMTAGERYGVRLRDGQDMAADLPAALARVAEAGRIGERTTTATDFDTETTERKEGSFYVGKDGRLMQQRGGLGSPVEGRGKGVKGGIPAADQERIRALVPIRDSLRKVLSADMAGNSAAAAAARTELNGTYDRFVQQFGPINKAEIRYQRPSVIEQESARAQAREEARLAGGFFSEGSFTPEDPNAKLAEIAAARRAAREASAALGRDWDEGDFDPAEMPDKVIVKRPNVDAFMDDQEGYRLRSIEHYNDDTGEAQKGAIFFRNVVSQEKVPEIRSANDALLYVLNRTGRPDLNEIADRAGISRSQAIDDLGDSVFRVPGQGETYQTREQYLSGNVRQKLDMARAEAARDPDLRRNVAALEAVQPALLGPSDISANLGMPWIPADVIKGFAESLGLSNINAVYRPKLAQWSVHGNAYGAAATTEWGTGRRNAIELLNDALNRQQTNIYDTYRDADGKEQRVINPVETQAAQDKVRDMRAKFSEWVWSDQKRAGDLVGLYNESYNNLVAPTYDGAYLTTPGIAESWGWRPHQTRVISRIIQSGNTYMAHAVGAGKTSAMIGAGMEMRRLGLVRKPMYAVPNHMLGQFTKEFYEQYPTAKIMVADERQFHTDRRKQFVANMATEDLDAVIITHSAFGFIPVSDAFADRLLKTQIDDFRGILNELKAEKSGDPSKRITVSRIEQQIESMTQKLSGRKKRADQVFTFEETGIDFLFVDEAHLFRKLDFATKMGSVRGVDPNGSAMSYDLYAKTRYLEEQNPGRSHVLASGTPVTNTMAELFSLQRYQQANELAARGLEQFDAWAGAFGETVTALEQDPAGGYKPQTRFAKFVNVPELSAMVRQVMDVVTSRQLEQYVVRPKLKGGSRQMIVAEPTPALQEYQQTLGTRMKAIEARRGKPKKGDDILLSVIGDGRKAAIDMRLVDPKLREEEQSKLEMLIDSVSRIAEETKAKPFYRAEAGGYASKAAFTGPATQMVFSDLGINGDFQIHRYIRSQLIARGLKDSEVAIISDYKTSVARQRLFNDMNEGKVRVLIGSVPKMGTGVNAQRRLYAIHNLDPQWYPANDEQRNGRGLRQGNMNPEIEIRDYSTKGTYDSTMWQMMETKARFIDGFFNGDPTLRSMDDLGEASQYEQAKALTTADPRILELTQYRQDLERAELRKAGFERSIFNAAERVRLAEEAIERQNRAIPAIEKDIAQRQDISGDNFVATAGGQKFTVRNEFGQAILDRMEEMAAAKTTVRDRKIGDISGFALTVDVAVYGKDTSVTLYLNRNGDQQQRIRAETADGISQSAAAVLRGFESDLAEARGKITRAETDIAEYTPQTKRTFAGQAEIDELAGNVGRIESQLTAEAAAKNAPTPLPPVAPDGAKLAVTDDTAGEALDMEAIRAKLAAEAKRMGVSGDRLVISTVDKLLNDRRVAGMYFNGVISVALDNGADPTATFHHEFVHALRDMGLFRGAEWTTLAKEARADAKIMARVRERYASLDQDGQTEEAVAIMFAQWQGARTGFMGAAFGRIRDFLAAVRQLVTRTQTAGDIMRRIDRGAIGARDGEAQAGEPRQSIVGNAAAPDPATVSEATQDAQTLVGKLGRGVDDWRVKLQDRMLPVLRAEAAVERVIGRELRDEERPYLAEELMTGRVGAKMDGLTDQHVDPLFAAMEAEKVSADELESFLYAKHAPERNAHIASINPDFADGSGSGMSDIEAAAILARIDRAGRTRDFERVAERVYGMLEFARNERQEAGLLSEEQADSWNTAYEFYVPLRGFAELDGANERPNGGGTGLTVRGAESKRAFGRRSKADDIIAHSIMQAEESIVRGEKNKVARAFYDLARASPDAEFWTVNKVTMKRQMNPLTGFVESYPVRALVGEDADWTVSLKIEGKEARVTMNKANPAARRLAEAMRRLDEQQSLGALVLLSRYSRWLSKVNTTLVPSFVITNMFRDVQAASINLAGVDVPGILKGTIKDYRKALAAATRGAFGKEEGEWGTWWREFTDAGGRTAYNQMQDLETLRKDMERRFDPKRRPNPNGLNTSPKQLAMIAMGDIKALFGDGGWIDNVNTGVENAVRLSAYKNARTAGLSKEKAASLAKNLTTNFNRRGTRGTQVNALYLFYNASVQGSARLLMAMRHPNVQKILAGIIVAGGAQELLSMMLADDDDDGESMYDKIPETEKQRNMIFMVKGPWGEYLKLPMPYGYSAFHSLGRNMVRGMRGSDRPMTVASDALMAFVDSFNPIGSGSLLNTIAPTFVDPVVDLTLNRDYASRPIMPDQSPYGAAVPDNQRYFANVGPQWKAVSNVLNVGTGGDQVVPGAVDVSPETLEYLFGVAVGGAGRFLDQSAGALGNAADGDDATELTVNDIPVVNKLVGRKPTWYDKAAFYARIKEVEQTVDNAKSYAQKEGTGAARTYIEKERPTIALMDAASAARKAMSEVRQARNGLELARDKGTIDQKAYAERMVKVKDGEKRVITAFNAAYLKAVKQPLRP